MPRSIMALPVSQTVISRQRHSRRRTEEYSFAMIHWDLQTPPLIYCTICSWLLIVFGSALICCPPIARSRTTVCRRPAAMGRSEEHTSELQSRVDLVCRLLLEKKKVR